MKWGFYDTADGLGMGDDRGPKTYDAEGIARVAAMVVDEQLGQAPGRTRAVPFADRPVRMRDAKDTRTTPLEAIRRLEGGDV